MAETNPLGDAAFTAARSKHNRAADDLLGVAQGKNRAAKVDPHKDRFAETAAAAKRDGWPNSGSGRERERAE